MKKNYKELLKESVLKEFDTSKITDVKGPMLDAILSYNGAGELTTHQDASSILERYYYGEKLDLGVETHGEEKVENEIAEVPKDNIEATKSDIEDELGGDETVDKRELGGDAIEEDIEIENTVIEKLIAEMDGDDEKDEDEDEDKDEKEMDVDKEVKESALPGFKTSTGYRVGTGGNVSTDLEEAFQLFQEQIEDEDEDEDEDKEKPLKEAEEKDDDDDDDDDDDEEDLTEAEEKDGDDEDDEELDENIMKSPQSSSVVRDVAGTGKAGRTIVKK